MRRAAAAALSDSHLSGEDVNSQQQQQGVGGSGGAASLASSHEQIMSRLASSSDLHLHRLVAHFIAARWPIAIALNKSDHVVNSKQALEQCRKRFPHKVLVPTSAFGELGALAACEVLGMHLPAACDKEVISDLINKMSSDSSSNSGSEDAKTIRKQLHAAQNVVETWGSTGVLEVISECVKMRPPSLVYPVSHLGTLAPLTTGAGLTEAMAAAALEGTTSSATTAAAPPLRDCLQMRPLSTVGDVYTACKRLNLCSGDFVRAEGKPAVAAAAAAGGGAGGGGGGDGRPCKKDEVVHSGVAVLRVQCTRKSQWQQQ